MGRSEPLLHRIGEVGATVGREPPRRRSVRIALQAGLALVIFGFLVLTVVQQWGEIRDEGLRFDLVWLAPAAVALLAFYALGAHGWDLILRFLGYRLSPARAQVAYGQPLLARYVPGSVLYVFGRLLLSERAGVPRRLTLASIVYEQALSGAAALSVASYFLIVHPDLDGQPLRWAVLAVVPLMLVFLHPGVFGPLANRVLRAFGREPLPATLPLRGVLVMLPYYAMLWCVAGVGVYFAARSVLDIPFAELATVGSAQAFGYVAALVTLVAPAGLGIRDAAFAWAVKVALPSQSFAVGAAIAIAVRMVLTICEVLYVGIVTVIGRREHSGQQVQGGGQAASSGQRAANSRDRPAAAPAGIPTAGPD